MAWLLAILAVAVTPYEMTVQTLDGAAVRGAIAEWSDSELVLSSSDGTSLRIARDEVTKITFSGAGATHPDAPNLQSLLVDGSTVPASGCRWNGAEVELVSSFDGTGSDSKWKLPADGIRAVRFNLSDADQDESWRELVDRERTSDWLVVYKKKRGTLDYVEGVIERVSSDGVTILLDDEPASIPLDRVFGIVFYRRASDAEAQAVLRIEGQHGLSLAGRNIRLGSEQVEIDLSVGGTITVPPNAISDIAFSSDKVLNLTDLDWNSSSKNWKPFFALPADSPLLEEWGLPRRDQSFSGNPLQLLVRDPSGRLALREFERGVAMRSQSEQTFSLPDGYKTLELLAGMDPEAHADSDAILLVELDGQSVGEWRIARSESAREILVDVTGKRRLRFMVDYGSGTDAGDVVHLCQPRLLK